MNQPSREDFASLARQYTVVPVWRQLLADLTTPVAAFARLAPREAGPAAEVISDGRARRVVVISVLLISALSLILIGVVATSNDCPGLSSDQVVATAAVRYAGCSQSTDAWSKGGR